jgi:hypothetical protein
VEKLSEKKYIINGYVAVKRQDHPKAMKDNLVYEHILIAEMMLGRPLRDDEQIHHLDFNRKNNKKSNILVLPKGQHTKLHNWIDRMELQPIIEAESDGKYHVEQCLNCGEYIKDYSNEKFCNRDCQDSYFQMKRNVRPSKDTLIALLNDVDLNKVEIGKMFGVHRSTINNWLRDYNLM